jgi:hypothetical protein
MILLLDEIDGDVEREDAKRMRTLSRRWAQRIA